MNKTKTIMWFRHDLRITDNPALNEACRSGDIIPIYIHDNHNNQSKQIGSASKWWLHQSLISLNNDLDGGLITLTGDPIKIIPKVVNDSGASSVVWNRNYEPWQITRDKTIKTKLEENGLKVKTFNGSLLWEPWKILNQSGTPYKVFTPFYRKGCLNADPPRIPEAKPNKINVVTLDDGFDVESLDLMPKIKWYKSMEKTWNPGEEGAKRKLYQFLDGPVNHYKTDRDFPGTKGTSRLSPHLHFGEISPNQVWHAALLNQNIQKVGKDLFHFLSELGWREFSYYLLYHFPEITNKNFNTTFDNYPWSSVTSTFDAWKRGRTGVPIVDAGMRELWETGYIHNRVRMIVGSYLVKNLNIDWRDGEEWFWDCLVDADLAANCASWQWVAGSGADAAPFFRIFNPILQGEKFDKDGNYVRKYCPELSKLPNKYIHQPWEAPQEILNESEIVLGIDYPTPIVDLKESRNDALAKYNIMRSA